ncbi:glycosyltransferase family 61 protein [Pontibacter sp. H249]|uniref:glycosyltransferase family 61 protein n=1 Tax=Pontibacter sp. H249 TaxID=3133420 RepID=UPI0030C0F69A
MNQLLLGRLSGNVPATVVNSVEEHLFNPIIRKHVEEVITIADPTIERYTFPSTFPPTFRKYKAFDKKNLYLLKNVSVSPFSGLAWIGNSYFLAESLGALHRLIGWGNILHEPLLKCEQLDEEEYVISCPNHPYYHWLFETLPNILLALEAMPSAKIMISNNSPAYCKDLLKFMFGEQGYLKRVIVADSVKVVPKFFSLQQEPDAGFIHPVAIQYLQQFPDELLRQASSSLTGSYIYISRRKAKKRQLANEEEVEQAMQNLGFTVLYCEDLTFIEQIAAFSKATFIVASHGGGLSNMVWATQKASILEVFAYDYFNDCFARLAVSLGFDYSYTFADEHKGSSGSINVKELVNTVESILKVEFQDDAALFFQEQYTTGFFPTTKIRRTFERSL